MAKFPWWCHSSSVCVDHIPPSPQLLWPDLLTLSCLLLHSCPKPFCQHFVFLPLCLCGQHGHFWKGQARSGRNASRRKCPSTSWPSAIKVFVLLTKRGELFQGILLSSILTSYFNSVIERHWLNCHFDLILLGNARDDMQITFMSIIVEKCLAWSCLFGPWILCCAPCASHQVAFSMGVMGCQNMTITWFVHTLIMSWEADIDCCEFLKSAH